MFQPSIFRCFHSLLVSGSRVNNFGILLRSLIEGKGNVAPPFLVVNALVINQEGDDVFLGGGKGKRWSFGRAILVMTSHIAFVTWKGGSHAGLMIWSLKNL